jgi:hypothetical protein
MKKMNARSLLTVLFRKFTSKSAATVATDANYPSARPSRTVRQLILHVSPVSRVKTQGNRTGPCLSAECEEEGRILNQSLICSVSAPLTCARADKPIGN